MMDFPNFPRKFPNSVATKYIRLNLDRKFTMQRLAQELNVSRRLLEVRFRQATGRTLHDELVRMRATAAQTLLRTTLRSVEDIALACGFSSASHLGTVCKALFNATPSALRDARETSRKNA